MCDHGQIKIIGCPQTYCRDIAFAVKLSDMFEKGLPPIAGGALDQSVWFLDAVTVLRNDEAMMRSEQSGK